MPLHRPAKEQLTILEAIEFLLDQAPDEDPNNVLDMLIDALAEGRIEADGGPLIRSRWREANIAGDRVRFDGMTGLTFGSWHTPTLSRAALLETFVSPANAKVDANNADEKRCMRELVAIIQANFDQPIPKVELVKRVTAVGTRMFNRAFAEAVKVTGASHWQAAGRRPTGRNPDP